VLRQVGVLLLQLGDRLAVVPHIQACQQVRIAREQVREPAQQRTACRRSHPRPLTLRERGMRRHDRAVRILAAAARNQRPRLTVGRVDGLDPFARVRLAPRAADVHGKSLHCRFNLYSNIRNTPEAAGATTGRENLERRHHTLAFDGG